MGTKHYFVDRNEYARRSDRCPWAAGDLHFGAAVTGRNWFRSCRYTKRALIIGAGEYVPSISDGALMLLARPVSVVLDAPSAQVARSSSALAGRA